MKDFKKFCVMLFAVSMIFNSACGKRGDEGNGVVANVQDTNTNNEHGVNEDIEENSKNASKRAEILQNVILAHSTYVENDENYSTASIPVAGINEENVIAYLRMQVKCMEDCLYSYEGSARVQIPITGQISGGNMTLTADYKAYIKDYMYGEMLPEIKYSYDDTFQLNGFDVYYQLSPIGTLYYIELSPEYGMEVRIQYDDIEDTEFSCNKLTKEDAITVLKAVMPNWFNIVDIEDCRHFTWEREYDGNEVMISYDWSAITDAGEEADLWAYGGEHSLKEDGKVVKTQYHTFYVYYNENQVIKTYASGGGIADDKAIRFEIKNLKNYYDMDLSADLDEFLQTVKLTLFENIAPVNESN